MSGIQPKSGDGVVVTTVRFPVELHRAFRSQAAKRGRSLNTHIVMTIRDAAGVEFGDHTPAAEKAQGKNHSEAVSHDKP